MVAIVGAEYIARLLPRGTHAWQKFVTPDELAAALRAAGLTPGPAQGMILDPLSRRWRLSRRTGVNYLMQAARAG